MQAESVVSSTAENADSRQLSDLTLSAQRLNNLPDVPKRARLELAHKLDAIDIENAPRSLGLETLAACAAINVNVPEKTAAVLCSVIHDAQQGVLAISNKDIVSLVCVLSNLGKQLITSDMRHHLWGIVVQHLKLQGGSMSDAQLITCLRRVATSRDVFISAREALHTLDELFSQRVTALSMKSQALLLRGFSQAHFYPAQSLEVMGAVISPRFNCFSPEQQASIFYSLAYFNCQNIELLKRLHAQLHPVDHYDLRSQIRLAWSFSVFSDHFEETARQFWKAGCSRILQKEELKSQAPIDYRKLIIVGIALSECIPSEVLSCYKPALNLSLVNAMSKFQSEVTAAAKLLGLPYRVEPVLGLHEVDLLVLYEGELYALEPGNIMFHGYKQGDGEVQLGADVLRARVLSVYGIKTIFISSGEWYGLKNYQPLQEERDLYGDQPELLVLAVRARYLEQLLSFEKRARDLNG